MKKEALYIAGPMCFYTDGYPLWNAMGDQARVAGFDVTMPSDKELDLGPDDLQKNAITIFENCARCMNESTAILCNLEFYRGPEPDGGSLYEVGMAYARGLPCYGFTRDKRPMVWKYQGSTLKDGVVYDRKGRPLPYGHLPFSPNVIGSTKIVEGGYEDCLKVFKTDMEEKRKLSASRSSAPASQPAATLPRQEKPVVYLAGPERWEADCQEIYAKMKAICEKHGLTAIVPTDDAPGVERIESDDPYAVAYNTFDRQQQHVRNCDIIVANLNDFHGWEPDSDTSFECGMGYQLGKKLFGYMDDTTRMIDRVPNLGAEKEYRDACGCNAENFDFPINLMFSGSMPILEGNFESVMERVAAALKGE